MKSLEIVEELKELKKEIELIPSLLEELITMIRWIG